MISHEEWLSLSNRLEQYHAVFYQLWQMGKPVFTNRIDTAAVQFNKGGDCIDFMFNPDFWKVLTDTDKLFIICHECLHVILNHGSRSIDSPDSERTNERLDVAVNEMLLSHFGFDRDSLIIAQDGCWVDTVFAGHPNLDEIPRNESFEYYYTLDNPNEKPRKVIVIDDHSFMSGDWGHIIDQLDQNLSPQEKEALKGLLEKHAKDLISKAGTGSGQWTFVDVEYTAPKKKWETVIKEWSLKYLRQELEDQEQWAVSNRRHVMLGTDLILPSEIEDDFFHKDAIPVFLFLDTSGSCIGFKERFFKAGLSLPKDKFKVRLFCFDTSVEEITFEDRKVKGGGGTAFDIIENHIQEVIKQEGIEYPEAVFLITDGEGNNVNPQRPERWYWFLTPYNSRTFIPKISKVFELKNYE